MIKLIPKLNFRLDHIWLVLLVCSFILLTLNIKYVSATIFIRIFPQDPVVIPLYDFIKNPIQLKIFKLFAEKFIDNPENDLVLILFCHLTVINEKYYSEEIRAYVFWSLP